MKASTLYRWLEWTFQPQTCTEVFPVIGLQQGNTDEITRVYTATFASPEVFEQLERLEANTCMLFTHHPRPQRLNTADAPPQIPQKWLDFLKERRISLFSYHIPLDRNSPFSPGVSLAKALGAEPYDSFFEQNQVRMGVSAPRRFPRLRSLHKHSSVRLAMLSRSIAMAGRHFRADASPSWLAAQKTHRSISSSATGASIPS